MREDLIEAWLFEHLGDQLEKCRLDWEVQEAQCKRASANIDRSAIKRKLSRLKELYVNEVIDLDEYRRDYELYTAQLAERPAVVQTPKPDFDAIAAVLSQDYRHIYDSLEHAEKRTLWRSVIKELHINRNREITKVVFCN